MPKVLIALGGNIGDARETIARAIAMLCDGAAVSLLARSSDYRTPPWGITDQPHFINACAMIETALSPLAVLKRAHEVERAFGRDRANETRWGPRTIDIDILAYDDIRLDTPELKLPHPRLFERGFVLLPLSEILPDGVIAHRRIVDAFVDADFSGIERLPDRAN